jgi:tetratricopeptide (TPR) repeat protein
MPTVLNSQIPPPRNWQDFEDLCRDVWEKIWGDHNTQKNGRSGQPQHGVDVYGRINESKWAGVQCKGKDTYSKQQLTETELIQEVEKAKTFSPKLSQFIIATTAPRDVCIQEVARLITDEHRQLGLFSVHVWSWEDILAVLAGHQDLIEKHYPEWGSTSKKLLQNMKNLEEGNLKILKQQTQSNDEIQSSLKGIQEKLNDFPPIAYPQIIADALSMEYHKELDHSRDLLNKHSTKEALDYLENLKRRIWHNASSVLKYRILTNIGGALLQQRQEQEGAKSFIEAYQYNPDDEKAMCNNALGHLLLGNKEEARKWCDMVLERNPANGIALSLRIQTLDEKETLDTVIENVPESFRNQTEVAYAIGFIALKRCEFQNAEKWFQIAIETGQEMHADSMAYLGIAIIQSVKHDTKFIHDAQTISDQNRNKLMKAIDLLANAWKLVSNTSLRQYRIDWLLHYAITEMILGNVEEANRIIEIGLEAAPDSVDLLRQKAAVAYEQKHIDKAIEVLEQIRDNPRYPDTPILLAEMLRLQNKLMEAMTVLDSFVQKNPGEPLKKQALQLMIQVNLDKKDLASAQEISSSLFDSYPDDLMTLILAAKIKKNLGEREEAVIILGEAKKYIESISKPHEIIMLADEFYRLDIYDEAAEIYKLLSPPCSVNPLTRKYLVSLCNSGRGEEALELCRSIRSKYGPQGSITRIEIEILNDINDIDELVKVCLEYLEVFHEDSEINLLLALTYFRTDNVEKLDEILKYPFVICELSIPAISQLAGLYHNRGQDKKALDMLYEMRRENFSDREAHQVYITFFLLHERTIDERLMPDTIAEDTCVCFDDESGHQARYIIENRADPNLYKNEISLDTPLARKLIGKKVGDEFIIEENPLSREMGKIISIQSKYVYALQDSMARFGTLFPGTQGFSRIRMGAPEKEGDMPSGINAIYEIMKYRHNSGKLIEQAYKEGKLTISVFAELSGSSVIDAFVNLLNRPELGIRCCTGAVEERASALYLIQKKPRLIADIITLLTLHSIDTESTVITEFGKLGISQTTLDLIIVSIDRLKENPSEMALSFDDRDQKVIVTKYEPVDIERNLHYLEDLKNWIQSNCEILPCREVMNLGQEQRNELNELNELLGRSSIDTILLAKEPGNLLYSDDAILRGFAKQEFNVDGVWTQAILLHLLNEKTLERSAYNSIVIQLVHSHFYHTAVDADVLLEAAKRSEWKAEEPFSSVISVLSGEFSDIESSVFVLIGFFKRLSNSSIQPLQRGDLIRASLEAISTNRDHLVLFEKIITEIDQNFYQSPSEHEELKSKIYSWRRKYDHI